MSIVKIRINQQEGSWDRVSFFGHVKNRWKKLPESVAGTEFARHIHRELERLAATPHSEECQVRRKLFRDRLEYEIKFHHDKIVAHVGPQLSPYLVGVLFGKLHATPNQQRRDVRRRPKSVMR